MGMDIRLVVGFCDHPKTIKLRRRAGPDAVLCLLRLWLWARVNRPDGVLSGMDADDVEIAAGWEGDPGALLDAAVAVGFVDHADDGYQLHDWGEHQGWACGQKRRSDAAKRAAEARWSRRAGDADRCGRNADASDRQCGRNAPSPSPSPSPSPNPGDQANSGDLDLAVEILQSATSSAVSEKKIGKSEIAISLYLKGGDLYHMTYDEIREWEQYYPTLSVREEIQDMAAWLSANPSKRKTKRGLKRFIQSWLSRSRKQQQQDPEHQQPTSNRREEEDATDWWRTPPHRDGTRMAREVQRQHDREALAERILGLEIDGIDVTKATPHMAMACTISQEARDTLREACSVEDPQAMALELREQYRREYGDEPIDAESYQSILQGPIKPNPIVEALLKRQGEQIGGIDGSG